MGRHDLEKDENHWSSGCGPPRAAFTLSTKPGLLAALGSGESQPFPHRAAPTTVWQEAVDASRCSALVPAYRAGHGEVLHLAGSSKTWVAHPRGRAVPGVPSAPCKRPVPAGASASRGPGSGSAPLADWAPAEPPLAGNPLPAEASQSGRGSPLRHNGDGPSGCDLTGIPCSATWVSVCKSPPPPAAVARCPALGGEGRALPRGDGARPAASPPFPALGPRHVCPSPAAAIPAQVAGLGLGLSGDPAGRLQAGVSLPPPLGEAASPSPAPGRVPPGSARSSVAPRPRRASPPLLPEPRRPSPPPPPPGPRAAGAMLQPSRVEPGAPGPGAGTVQPAGSARGVQRSPRPRSATAREAGVERNRPRTRSPGTSFRIPFLWIPGDA